MRAKIQHGLVTEAGTVRVKKHCPSRGVRGRFHKDKGLIIVSDRAESVA